jgi:ferric-dicitrate binding protein FerR (iron transport regulator)
VGVLDSLNMPEAQTHRQGKRRRSKRREEFERRRASYEESARALIELEEEEANPSQLSRLPGTHLTEAALAIERQKVRRLEISQLGDFMLASAAGVAAVGGLFGAPGAAAGAVLGGALGLGLRLRLAHNH